MCFKNASIKHTLKKIKGNLNFIYFGHYMINNKFVIKFTKCIFTAIQTHSNHNNKV